MAAATVTALRVGLSDSDDFDPTKSYTKPIKFETDFVGHGTTVIDLELANETGFYAKFFSPLKLDASGGTEGDETGEWLVSYDAITAVTQLPACGSADGGRCVATTDATSGERISMQLTGAAFKFAVGRPLIFKWKGSFGATTGDCFIGLAVTGATDPHASRPLGFVAFTRTAGAGWQFASGDGAADTASAALTTATNHTANTDQTLCMWWDGVAQVDFYVDGSFKASATLTLPLDLVLSPVICVESNGAAESISSDALLVCGKRA